VDFFDVDGLVETANRVLDAPQEFKHLGVAAAEMIRDRYSMEACLPRLLECYQEAMTARPGYDAISTASNNHPLDRS
jgi:hypothetical protein